MGDTSETHTTLIYMYGCLQQVSTIVPFSSVDQLQNKRIEFKIKFQYYKYNSTLSIWDLGKSCLWQHYFVKCFYGWISLFWQLCEALIPSLVKHNRFSLTLCKAWVQTLMNAEHDFACANDFNLFLTPSLLFVYFDPQILSDLVPQLGSHSH